MQRFCTIFYKLMKNTADGIRLEAQILLRRPQVIVAEALENQEICRCKNINQQINVFDISVCHRTCCVIRIQVKANIIFGKSITRLRIFPL